MMHGRDAIRIGTNKSIVAFLIAPVVGRPKMCQLLETDHYVGMLRLERLERMHPPRMRCSGASGS
jgi:hypothetical protein